MTYGRRYATLMIAAVGFFATLIFLVLPQAPASARLSTSERSDLVFSEHGESTWNTGLAEASLSTSEIGEVSAYRLNGGSKGGSDDPARMLADELPTVTLEAVTDSVIEGEGPMTLRLNADPPQGSDVVVTLSATQPDNASWLPAGYTEHFEVKIPADATMREFNIPVRNVYNVDDEGSVEVKLVDDTNNYKTGDPALATVEMIDDDVPITLTYADDSDISVPEDAGTLEVHLELRVDEKLRPGTYYIEDETSEGAPFLIETSVGTALPPGDYEHSFHVIRLPVGSFVKDSSGYYVATVTVEWAIKDDLLDEGDDEYFYVSLPFASIPALAQPVEPKRILIADNDVAAIKLIADAVDIEEGDSVQVWAQLEGEVVFGQPETFAVEFDGLAREEQDYEADSDKLNFAVGSNRSTDVVNITSMEDSIPEAPETIEVKLKRGSEDATDQITLSLTDRKSPSLESVSVDGSMVTLTFDENLDEDSIAASSAFAVSVDEVGITVANVTVAGPTVTMEVDPVVEAGQVVTLSYSVPDSMPLQGTDSDQVIAIDRVSVMNATANRPPLFLADEATVEYGAVVDVGREIIEFEVRDEDASQDLTFTLEGDNDDMFLLSSDGVRARISLKREVDRSVTRIYELVLGVDDGNGGTDSAEISITFLRLGAPGEVSMMPDRPMQSLPVAANLTDDGGVSGEVDWEWGVSDTANGMFVSAQRSSSSVYVPTADDVGMYLKATAHYNDLQGTGRRAEMVSSEPVGADIPDDITTGGRITVDGGPVSGYIDPGYVTFTMNGEQECTDIRRVFDHDWWGIEVAEGRSYVIEMRGADTDDGTLLETRLWGMANTEGEDKTDDEYLDVYDAYGDISSGSGRNSWMVFTAVETGLVYIDVSSNNAMDVDLDACPITSHYPARQTGSYEVEVTSVTGVLPGQSGATPISVGASFAGIFDEFERRWFVVSLTSGVEYELVNSYGSHERSKLNFPVIYGVYDRNGDALRDSSVGVHGYGDAVVTYMPETSGDYYIQIGDGTQGGVWVDGGPSGAFHFAINEIGP